MDCNENELDTESDEEEEDDEGGSSGSDEDESGDDDDDDGSGYESVDEIIETVPGEGAENAEGLNFSSDDDPEKESCPICLNKFIGQDLGFPESCDHTFCFECIKEWSKNINTCPIDRTEFNYIHIKDAGGAVLRKVKVSVAPKEPEASLEETPTLCEVCHSGDREDRLLLCDGCDVAYHCECLDPPLFYIPIEEWFCPTCLDVFDSRAMAGPSRSGTRRVIPRTRASETVRSRVQILRTMRTPRSPSTSQPRKTKTQNAPKRKKRRRRYYGKAIRKVVTLARTKKDMNAGQKGKVGTRSSTVIVTYRRKRCKRRRRKVSKRSAASSKVLTIPSSKQRIAMHLGIGKSLKGSTVAQIKKPAAGGSRSATIKCKLPLFGNKDQLMDFSENFNEDMRDASATSASKTSKRSSTDACPSTSSGISLLDSILAGQKILQAKSDKILIKTDGSLILKDDTKKQNNVRKIVNDPPSHTPMSIALAKQGVRTSLLDKNSSSSCKKHADTSKLKNVSDRKIPKSSNDILSENRSSIGKVSARSSSKLFDILSNDAKSYSNNERKNYLSTTKNGVGIKSKKAITSEVDDFSSFAELDGITSDIPSNRNKAIDINNKTNRLTVVSKTKNINNQKLKICNNSDNFSTIASSSSSAISSKTSIESLIKREIPSDEKSNNDSQTTNIQKVQIKQETLSDEETNIDSWNEHSGNREQEFNDIITNIKKEPVDPDLKINSIKDYKNLEVNKNVLSGSSQENNLSDFNASQSIIDSVPYDVLNTTQVNKLCKNTKLLKVKEEIPSDTEDYSQSLILDSTSGNIDRLSHMKSLFSIKKEPFDSADAKSPEKENACHQTKRADFTERLESRSVTFSSNLLENELPCTQAVASPSDSESEYDDLPCTQAFSQVPAIDSEDDEISSAQAPSHAETDSEDDEISSAQAPSNAETDSEDDEISSAQALSHAETDSEDDEISSAQAPSHAETDSEDDEISSVQVPAHAATDSEDDEIPCTQVSSQVATDSEDDEIPRTQAVPACAATDSEEEEDDDNNDDDIPCTQAAFIPSKICDKEGDTPSSFDTSELNSRKIADNTLPPTQNALCVNENANSQVSKKDFEFKKPSVISTKKAFFTENNKVSNRKSSRNSLLPTFSECELPSTQVATFCAPTNKNKDKSPNQISNNLKSVKSSSKGHNFDIDDSSLPLTQVSSLNPKQVTNLSDTAGRHLNLELSNVHATQIYDTNSQNIEELTAPETQIFKAITDKKILDSQSSVSPSESFDLPPTQIFNISDTGQNACVDNQVLPHTQSICSNSKELCIGSESNEQDNNICKKDMNEIISNIKQIVNSLSSKVHENENWQNISNGISNDELVPNFNNTLNYLDETLGSKNTLSEDKNVPSGNSNDALPEGSKELSFISTEKQSQNNVQSSDDEEFSLEKFKESLKKSKPVTPKKYGIHKHLPQVIAAVPVKENVKIKPSNKRTFSFEEVVKLQKPSIQPKPSINSSSKSGIPESKIPENCESDSNDDNDSLPPTQLVETVNNKRYKSNHLRPQNNNFGTKKHIINQELGNHLNEKSDFHSSSTLENDKFSAIQSMISEVSEKNSHLLNEKNDSKSINSNNSFQNSKRKLVRQTVKDDFAVPASVTEDDFSDLCFTQKNGVISSHNKNAKAKKHPAIDTSKKKLTSKLDLSENSDSSVDFIDSGDLPATQICNNLTSTNLVRTYKVSNNNTEATSVENHQNNAFEKNKDIENSYLKNGYASKRKNSFDEITKNKKVCNQIADKSHSKKNNDIDVNEQSVNKGCEKSLSSEIIDGLKENCTRNDITIKQEKDDFEFIKPSHNAQIFNSSAPVSCLNLNIIKIEKIDPCDDFLPPTQAVNFNHLEDNSLPHTQVTNTNLLDTNKKMNSNYSKSIQNKFLSPSKIKKEPCSDDDEISVIEEGTTSNVKVEEVILIDDDDVVENYKQSLSNFQVIKGKEIPSERIDLSSIKKEKCSDAYILSESEPDMRSLNSTCEKSENFNKKCSKDSKKKGDDSTKSKHDDQNHKHIEPKKNKRNSPESSISKKDIKNSKDLHTSKEKVRKNSFDLHTSEEKSKRNSKDHHPGEKSKNPASERKNTNLKDLPRQGKNECLKNVHELSKKSSHSKDSKSSKKEIIDSHNSRVSCEKDRKKFKDHSCSKEKKNKLDEMDVLKSQPKSNKSDSTNSASKSKVNIDKCGSLSKSTNSIAKHSEKSKDSSVNKSSSKSKNYHHSKIEAVADKVEKEKQKHSEEKTLERKSDKSSDKDRRCSSEKENRNKNNKDVIIAVKSENKRSHNDVSDQYNQKKRKIGHSLDSESNSSEDIAIQLSDLPNDFYKYSNFNDGMQMECDGISNRLSASKDIGNANELHSKPGQMADIKKITSKQDLKEEIANEVKLVLKPFYNTGLISKDDYKDIMRRAVPKIFMNCHKTIHTEKIRKLVLNYVSLLNNRS